VESKIVRKMLLGFIQIHILHHADQDPIYGVWMIDELNRHGYSLSAGTIYPILHSLESEGLLDCENRLVEGKIRKYYRLTDQGRAALAAAREKAYELCREIRD